MSLVIDASIVFRLFAEVKGDAPSAFGRRGHRAGIHRCPPPSA